MARHKSRGNVHKHRFSDTPRSNIPRSTFNRSHGHKTTFDAGQCIPIFIDEVLPGDTFNLRTNGFVRLATPLKPFMDNLWMDLHYFFVPLRQIWDDFRLFMGEQANPSDDPSSVVAPAYAAVAGGYQSQSLQDYLGIPIGVGGFQYSRLPINAYYHIWNEWYRDQNLNNSVSFSRESTVIPDAPELLPQYRNKRFDYFTGALPWPQKGDPVLLPLGQSAPVVTPKTLQGELIIIEDGTGQYRNMHSDFGIGTNEVGLGVTTGDVTDAIYADLTQATASTVNQIREAFQIQKLLERDARGGTRYSEIVKSHFGTDFLDITYRPEFLGGGTFPVSVHSVPQTGASGIDQSIIATPQGNVAAFGTVAIQGAGFTKSFTEHGFVMGIASVRADLTYQQGLQRLWSRSTRYDYYWPALSHLGEQAILNIEIFTQGTPADADVFGYIPRYDEYRHHPSRISGKLRSNDPVTLDYWHLSQDFATLPALDASFIRENPPLDRVVAVTDEPKFIADFFFDLKCARPMPVYAVPGLIDHF